MKKEFFNYELPEDLIAQVPLPHRSASRLLVCNANNNSITDKNFSEINDTLKLLFSLKKSNKKLLLIANDSKVYPARVRVQRATGGRGEVFFLERGQKDTYSCLLRPKSKLKLGEVLYSDDGNNEALFKVTSLEPPFVSLLPPLALDAILEKYGEMPLPPYIQRDPHKIKNLSQVDKERYQTVYANYKEQGSSAAPTAGLHFTEDIIAQCEKDNIEFTSTTLHVGLGTFLPVQAENVDAHEMHHEMYLISSELLNKIIVYLENDWPIVFIGTTALRSVESFFRMIFSNLNYTEFKLLLNEKKLRNYLMPFADKWYSTNLFIYPKNKTEKIKPFVGHGIITNFHQPCSTLVMLISALMGYEFWQEFYKHAIAQQYRFLSYGDSSLLIFGAND